MKQTNQNNHKLENRNLPSLDSGKNAYNAEKEQEEIEKYLRIKLGIEDDSKNQNNISIVNQV